MLGYFAHFFIRGRRDGQLLRDVKVGSISIMKSAHFSHILRVGRTTGRLPVYRTFEGKMTNSSSTTSSRGTSHPSCGIFITNDS